MVDNCEHVVEAVVRLVDALLDSCPGLRILATSREPLNAAGEVTWVVPSLTVPYSRQEAYTPQELETYEPARSLLRVDITERAGGGAGMPTVEGHPAGHRAGRRADSPDYS